jgi:hypothetical protein
MTRAVRRSAAALALACSCAAHEAPLVAPGAPAASPPLRLDPLASIVPGAGLEWLAVVRPRELLSNEAAAAQVEPLFPEATAARFRARYGGVDLRGAEEIVVAGYDGTLFGAARVAVDPAPIEAAFARRARDVEGRAQSNGVVRFWGTVDGAREQVAVFGHEAAAIEHGGLGPLRPALLFAEGRLQRTQPAVRAEPLAALFARLNDPAPPLAFYAPGPFGEPWASGVGGLLRATTGVAIAAACATTGVVGPPAAGAGCSRLQVRVVLAGAWGADGPLAGERLAAAFRALAADPLGRLTGIDHPLAGPSIATDDRAVELDVTLDLASLAGGIHDVTGASLPEILGLSAAH